jgi:integrase
LRSSSINTMMHGVRGFFRFAHIDGLIPADPAVYARLPKIHKDETRTQGLDRLELIRFLQVAQTITVHHGALAYLLGINALRASEAAAVRIEDYHEPLCGHRVLHLVGKGNKPATMPLTVPVLRVLEACRGQRTDGPLVRRPVSGKPIDRRDCYRMVARIAKAAGIPRHISPHSCAMPRSPTPSTPACRCGTPKSWPGTPTHGPPSTTIAPAATSTATASTSSPPASQASEVPRTSTSPHF